MILAKTPNAPVKMEFTYDYQSRRIQKKVFVWNPTTLNTQLSTHNVYLYDGWNCVAEIDGLTGQPKRTYLWGLDIGEMGGTRSPSASPGSAAGGVGGQLAQTYYNDQGQAIATMLPVYDGNGNITALVSATDGAITAQFEYSPFGETIKETGPLAKANTYKFSTKPEDRESGFYNYTLRIYTPQNGRFISADPIEENGGVNLYGFVGNDGVNGVDILGLKIFFVMYYYNEASDPNGSFRRAALTWVKYIKKSPSWDEDCDIVIIKKFTKETEFVAAWISIDREAKDWQKKSDKKCRCKGENKINQGIIFSHGTGSGIELPDGTLNKSDIEALPLLDWAVVGSLSVRACNSGTGNHPYINSFSKTQGIQVDGQVGYSYFSEDPNRYSKIDQHGGGTSRDVYLRAYQRGKNQYTGDGKMIAPLTIPAP